MEIKEEEMKKINGGAIGSAFINAVTKAINSIYELGRQTGSAIRRLVKGSYCPIR